MGMPIPCENILQEMKNKMGPVKGGDISQSSEVNQLKMAKITESQILNK